MPIDLVCTGCSQSLRAPDEQAGRSVRCPHCEAVNQVPAPEGTVVLAHLASPFAPSADAHTRYPAPAPLGDDPAIRMLLPVGRSGWAIAAGYLGLFSVLCFPAPISVILGVIAIVHLRRNPKLYGMGRAIFGLVMGVLGCIPLVVMLDEMFAQWTR